MFFDSKILKSENNNPWFKPWVNILYLEFQSRFYTFIFEIINCQNGCQNFWCNHTLKTLYFQAGEKKLFLFVVDQEDVNYLAVSSNVAIEGTRGGPERYELYMKYGAPPTTRNYDQRSTLTASDSYVGDVLYR